LKSDREIARLLRQSHRLLNLRRRHRSGISHRERWTDYELRLLGRILDEELAKLLRRGVSAVAGKRESLGIPFSLTGAADRCSGLVIDAVSNVPTRPLPGDLIAGCLAFAMPLTLGLLSTGSWCAVDDAR